MTTIKILKTRAILKDSKRIAKEHGGKLPTLRDFILAMKDDNFFERAKGSWYWLDGKGIDVDGNCRIDYDKGTINKVTKEIWDSLPIRERAYAYKGSGTLALYVGYDDWDGRLYVVTVFGPQGVAPRVAFVLSEERLAQPAKEITLNGHKYRLVD